MHPDVRPTHDVVLNIVAKVGGDGDGARRALCDARDRREILIAVARVAAGEQRSDMPQARRISARPRRRPERLDGAGARRGELRLRLARRQRRALRRRPLALREARPVGPDLVRVLDEHREVGGERRPHGRCLRARVGIDAVAAESEHERDVAHVRVRCHRRHVDPAVHTTQIAECNHVLPRNATRVDVAVFRVERAARRQHLAKHRVRGQITIDPISLRVVVDVQQIHESMQAPLRRVLREMRDHLRMKQRRVRDRSLKRRRRIWQPHSQRRDWIVVVHANNCNLIRSAVSRRAIDHADAVFSQTGRVRIRHRRHKIAPRMLHISRACPLNCV